MTNKSFPLARWLAALLFAVLSLSVFLPAIAGAQEPATQEEPAPEAPEFDAPLTDEATDPDLMELLVLPLTVDELSSLGDIWLGLVKDGTKQVTSLRIQLSEAAESPESQALRDQLSAALEARGNAFENLSVVVDSYEAKGGDPAVVSTFRAYRNAVLAVEAQRTDWRTLLDLGLKWVTDRDGGLAFVWKIGVVVATFLGLIVLARIIRRFARRALGQVPNISSLLIAFLSGTVYWIVVAIGLMVVLSALGVNVTPLFALFGGAAFIIAFAMQDTLGNLASGVMIIINRPFDEGDYVNVAGVGGTVRSVSIVSTTITTPDNQVIVIPNSKVWGDIINNVTASDTRRVDLVFGIGYGDSISTAQMVLERVVNEHPMILAEPAPVIRVNELADSSVNFVCRPWVQTSDYWTVYWDLTRLVKEAFDAEGISIPFPQTDMHLHVSGPVPLDAPRTLSAEEGEGRPKGAMDFASGDAPSD